MAWFSCLAAIMMKVSQWTLIGESNVNWKSQEVVVMVISHFIGWPRGQGPKSQAPTSEALGGFDSSWIRNGNLSSSTIFKVDDRLCNARCPWHWNSCTGYLSRIAEEADDVLMVHLSTKFRIFTQRSKYWSPAQGMQSFISILAAIGLSWFRVN